jgi:hypothetical protein
MKRYNTAKFNKFDNIKKGLQKVSKQLTDLDAKSKQKVSETFNNIKSNNELKKQTHILNKVKELEDRKVEEQFKVLERKAKKETVVKKKRKSQETIEKRKGYLREQRKLQRTKSREPIQPIINPVEIKKSPQKSTPKNKNKYLIPGLVVGGLGLENAVTGYVGYKIGQRKNKKRRR